MSTDITVVLTHPSLNLTTPSTPGCLPTPATSILFQLSHIVLLFAYLIPGGLYSLIFTHSTLAFGHLLLIIWIYGVACYRAQFPTLIGWSITYLSVNILRVLYQLYCTTVKGRISAEFVFIYEQLFEPVRVQKREFIKLVARGRLMTLQIGESYAVEGVTPTNRLGLLISGKINVMSASQFLHFINPCEFLDSPEWESSSSTKSSSLTCNGSAKKNFFSRKSQSTKSVKGTDLTNFGKVNSASRYEKFDGTTGKTGKERKPTEVQQRFNISLIAAATSTYIVWDRSNLEYFLAKNGYMATVLSLLLARDITNKLYQMNEKISNEKGSQIDIRLPVIINSFTRRHETSSSLLPANHPRSLVSRQNSTDQQSRKTAAAAISTLATASTSRSLERPVISSNGASNGSSGNNNFTRRDAREKESPAATCSRSSQDTTTSHSSSEIFINMKNAETKPIPELPKSPDVDSEDEEDQEEISTSASYAAMSLSDNGSNWNTINSIGSITKKLTSSKITNDQTETVAVNIPLLPKSCKHS